MLLLLFLLIISVHAEQQQEQRRDEEMTRRITQTNSLLIENVALLAGLLVINKNSSSSVMSTNQFNPAAEDPELSMTTVCTVFMIDYYYFSRWLYDCHAARIDRPSRLSSRNPFGYDR